MLLEAQRRGPRLSYATQRALWLDVCDAHGMLARKDPPFENQFLYDTLLLEQAAARGTLVVNAPQALRDANEKLFALLFPDCIPETRVARDPRLLREFVESVGEAVLKPLDGMAGRSIFR